MTPAALAAALMPSAAVALSTLSVIFACSASRAIRCHFASPTTG